MTSADRIRNEIMLLEAANKRLAADGAALAKLRALLDKHRRERLYGDVRDARGHAYMPDSAETEIARRTLMETDAEVIARLVAMAKSGADAKDIASRIRKELAPVLGIDEQAMPADAMAELAAERLNARLPEHARGSVAPGTTATEANVKMVDNADVAVKIGGRATPFSTSEPSRPYLEAVVALLRILHSCAFTHDAAGRPICVSCNYVSKIVGRRGADGPDHTRISEYILRTHHHPDCELVRLLHEGEALLAGVAAKEPT